MTHGAHQNHPQGLAQAQDSSARVSSDGYHHRIDSGFASVRGLRLLGVVHSLRDSR